MHVLPAAEFPIKTNFIFVTGDAQITLLLTLLLLLLILLYIITI